MSQDWDQIRAAYPEDWHEPLKFLYGLPDRYRAELEAARRPDGNTAFLVYPRRKPKLFIYQVAPKGMHQVNFQPPKLDERLGLAGTSWSAGRLRDAFGPAVQPGEKSHYWHIALRDIDARRDAMTRFLDDVVVRLRQQ